MELILILLLVLLVAGSGLSPAPYNRAGGLISLILTVFLIVYLVRLL